MVAVGSVAGAEMNRTGGPVATLAREAGGVDRRCRADHPDDQAVGGLPAEGDERRHRAPDTRGTELHVLLGCLEVGSAQA